MMSRKLISFVLSVCWAGAAFVGAAGAQSPMDALASPVDALQGPEDVGGRLEYGIGLAVAPGSGAIYGIGGQGYGGTASEYRLSLQGDVTYALSSRVALSAALRTDTAAVRIVPPPGFGSAAPWTWGPTRWEGSTAVRWRAAPTHPWDPVLSVGTVFGDAEGGILHAGGQRISDPVVIEAGMSIRAPRAGAAPEGGGVRLGVNGGMEFVFNDEFSLGARVEHRFASVQEPRPATAFALGWRQRRGFDGGGVQYDIVFVEQGGAVAVQLGVTWRGGGKVARSP